MDSLYAIKKSIKNYASGGNVLIVATLLAFIIANSPIADMYFLGGHNLYLYSWGISTYLAIMGIL